MIHALSLAAGLGGIDLGLKLVYGDAYQTLAYCEIDPFCQDVLLRRAEDGWLDRAPIWPDLRTFDGIAWRGRVDLVFGGPPCQPFSVAGKRRGADDARNLVPDFLRVVRECEPAGVFLENVPGSLPYQFHVVLPELQGMGYRVAAGLFRASDVGAPHKRERLFVLAHQVGRSLWDERRGRDGAGRSDTPLAGDAGGTVGDTEDDHGRGRVGGEEAGVGAEGERRGRLASASNPLGDALSAGLEERGAQRGDMGEERPPAERAGIPCWPPGPAERDRWRAVLARWPELAPALSIAEWDALGISQPFASRG